MQKSSAKATKATSMRHQSYLKGNLGKNQVQPSESAFICTTIHMNLRILRKFSLPYVTFVTHLTHLTLWLRLRRAVSICGCITLLRLSGGQRTPARPCTTDLRELEAALFLGPHAAFPLAARLAPVHDPVADHEHPGTAE